MRPPRDWTVFGADRDTGAERAIRVRAPDAAEAEQIARRQRILVAEVRSDAVEEAVVVDAPPNESAPPLQYANLTKKDQAWIAEWPTPLGEEYLSILAGAKFLDGSAFVLRIVGLIGVGGGLAYVLLIAVVYARSGGGDLWTPTTLAIFAAVLSAAWWFLFWCCRWR